jgi:hypothetical protein
MHRNAVSYTPASTGHGTRGSISTTLLATVTIVDVPTSSFDMPVPPRHCTITTPVGTVATTRILTGTRARHGRTCRQKDGLRALHHQRLQASPTLGGETVTDSDITTHVHNDSGLRHSKQKNQNHSSHSTGVQRVYLSPRKKVSTSRITFSTIGLSTVMQCTT